MVSKKKTPDGVSCFRPGTKANGTMRQRVRQRRGPIVHQEMVERGGVAMHAFVVAVRAAKLFYLFYLGVVILFYLTRLPWPSSTVQTKNESCAWWALDRVCAGGTPYHVEISYPGTRESAVQGEPQESDTLSCKKACPLLFGRAHFYKQYPECERCKLSKIGRQRASLTNAGLARPGPVMLSPPPPSPPQQTGSINLDGANLSHANLRGVDIIADGGFGVANISAVDTNFALPPPPLSPPLPPPPSPPLPPSLLNQLNQRPAKAKNWSIKYAGQTVGPMVDDDLDLSKFVMSHGDFGKPDFEGA